MTIDKPHILVVDDDNRLRTLLKKFLSEQGFLVTVAADAAEARRKLAWFSFDLMVLDIMMPGEDGLSLLTSLAGSDMPILMLSARSETDDRISRFDYWPTGQLKKSTLPDGASLTFTYDAAQRLTDVTDETIALTVAQLAADRPLRARLRAATTAMLDGQGAARAFDLLTA